MKCLTVLCLVALGLQLEHSAPFQATCPGKVQLQWGCSGTATKLLVGLECAQGAALNTGLVHQVKAGRKRARRDPTSACSSSVCGN